jgi:hypothetical protein
VDIDEIMYRLYVLDKIRKGREAVETGPLQQQCAERAPLFRPEGEREAWQSLLAGLSG